MPGSAHACRVEGFVHDDNVSELVLIEAEDANQANDIAERVGIYFDGCSEGRDCHCCGDRWYRAMSDDVSDKLEENGNPLEEYESHWMKEPVTVHYKDGRVVKYGKGTDR